MGTVNLKEARRRLGDLVRAAERGESTAITRRGRRVARIVSARDDIDFEELPDLTDFRQSISLAGEPMSQTVIDMRREERS
jgi:prevent-host-death family protein